MNTITIDPAEVENARARWVKDVEDLAVQLSAWAGENNWQVQQTLRAINEEALGAYIVPDLVIGTPGGQVTMVAKPHGVPEATGRVELSAWPTLYRVWLMRKSGATDWIIRTDSGIALRHSWTKNTFITLVGDLVAAE